MPARAVLSASAAVLARRGESACSGCWTGVMVEAILPFQVSVSLVVYPGDGGSRGSRACAGSPLADPSWLGPSATGVLAVAGVLISP